MAADPVPAPVDVRVRLEGAVDIAVTPDLRRRLLHNGATRHARLVVDLTDVTLLDASALGVFAAAAQAYVEVELRGASPQNRRVLELGGMTRVARLT